jgi:beta-glucosidase
VADLLFGEASPSGKLPMTFPRTVGQLPLYYAQRETGRPYDDSSELARHYSTHYVDVANTPLYPFGYGLDYTTFAIDQVRTDSATLAPDGTLTVRARVRNTGRRAGTDVVQLYVHDRVASVSPPMRLLKGFQRVTVPAGGATEVRFILRPRDLAFRRVDGTVGTEPGDYDIYVGDDATATASAAFTLTDH